MSVTKVVHDGKVAVIYNPCFGGAWYSSDLCWINELLFDPKLVEIILHPSFKNMRYKGSEECKYDEELDTKINDYIEDVNSRNYITPDGISEYIIYDKSTIYDLDIYWVPVGKKFFITNYDGAETVHVEDEIEWLKA